MGERPAISVVMPVYNGGIYLSAAVGSVLGQTFGDFELVVIDDGSTDGSLGVLRGFERQDRRVRVVSRENRGLVRTLNEGMEMVRGEFVARMDADDVAMPERFGRQVAFLKERPEVVAVGSGFELIDEKGRLLTRIVPAVGDEEIQRLLLAGHTSLCHPTVMMRTEAVRRVGGYDAGTFPTEDLDLFLRLGEVGKLANLPEALLKYRLHGGSISGEAPVRQREAARRVCEAAWERRGVKGEFEASRPWRPGADRESQHEFALKYGWWAFNSGEKKTAMAYGVKAVVKMPWREAGWRLLACAVVKSPEGGADESGAALRSLARPSLHPGVKS